MDYCDVEWFALKMKQDHFVVFEIVPIIGLLVSFCIISIVVRFLMFIFIECTFYKNMFYIEIQGSKMF